MKVGGPKVSCSVNKRDDGGQDRKGTLDGGNNKMLGKSGGVYIVSEVGSNFNGALDTALRFVTTAREAGVDAVKFQTLRKESLVAPHAQVGGRLVENPVYRDFANLELPDEWHFTLKRAADEVGIEFFSTPFSLEAVELLETVGVCAYKIASGDITFLPLLKAVGATGKPVILSTGASSLDEVGRAVEVLSRSGAREISLLHCVSMYPPRWSEMNLQAMVTLKEAFGLPVGISDHSPGTLVPLAAVALGATIVEKHVTFDRGAQGPDHPFALTMEEFRELVVQIRRLEEALGSGEKVPTPSELAGRHRMRRAVYDPVTMELAEGTDGIWLRPEHGVVGATRE